MTQLLLGDQSRRDVVDGDVVGGGTRRVRCGHVIEHHRVDHGSEARAADTLAEALIVILPVGQTGVKSPRPRPLDACPGRHAAENAAGGHAWPPKSEVTDPSSKTARMASAISGPIERTVSLSNRSEGLELFVCTHVHQNRVQVPIEVCWVSLESLDGLVTRIQVRHHP